MAALSPNSYYATHNPFATHPAASRLPVAMAPMGVNPAAVATPIGQPFGPMPQLMSPQATAQAIQQLPGAASMPPEIFHALVLAGQIGHLPQDEAHMRRLGVDLIFRNGQEALKVILSKGCRVEFGDMGDSKAHAQWIKDQNLIMINQKYRGDLSKDTLYAISEAIYHEAGHAARLGDDQASIQEETNCLALNTLAHRWHKATDPEYGANQRDSRLINDGVALYPKLFFDPDPEKKALVNRIIEKYGMLPAETPDHRIPAIVSPPVQVANDNLPIAYRVMRHLHDANLPRQWVA